MSGFAFLPALTLPRLSETGSVVGGSTSLGSPSSGSISSRYAAMRATATAAQGALTARTPRPAQRPPPEGLSPIRSTHMASLRSPQGVPMTLETAASPELQVLNAHRTPSPIDDAPAVPEENTLLLLLPGYTEPDALLQLLRSSSLPFRIATEEGRPERQRVRKVVFTKDQAVEFCAATTTTTPAEKEEEEEKEQAVEDEYREDEQPQEERQSSNEEEEDEPQASPAPMQLAPPAPESLLGSVAFAIHIRGPDAISALASWVDEQEQRAYVHVSANGADADRELGLVFQAFRPPAQTTLALIKPDAIASGHFASIMRRIEQEGFEVERVEEQLRFTEASARQFYAEHAEKAFYPLLVKFMSSGPLVALALKKENAILSWRKLIGSQAVANSLRGLYATDGTRNAVHGSDSIEAAARELDFIFGAGSSVAPPSQTTFALIKPAAMAHKEAILARLEAEGFDLTRIQQVERLSTEQARLFFYTKTMYQQAPPIVEKQSAAAIAAAAAASAASGLPSPRRDQLPPAAPPASVDRPSFEMLLESLQKGACLAIQMKRDFAVRTLRRIVGGNPAENLLDPTLARLADSNCLRAQYGTSVLHNALHISGTLDDARRECALFFANQKFYPPIGQTFLLIKPNAAGAPHAEAIVARLVRERFTILRQKKLQLAALQVRTLFPDLDSDDQSNEQATFISSGPVVALQLQRADAVDELQRLCGIVDEKDLLAGANPIEALKVSAPQSLRALYGVDDLMDGVCPAVSSAEASRLITQIFHVWHPSVQHTYAMIKPDAYATKGAVDAILARLKEEGFEVIRKSKLHLSKAQAAAFYAEHAGRIFQPALIDFMTSGPALALELRKLDAVRAWRTLLGPTDSTVAKRTAPTSLRALYGTDGRRNACHGSDSAESARRELDLVFGQFVPMIETTCCILKPEALVANVAKAMLQRILAEGFEVVKQEKMTLTSTDAMRLYAEHAGALYFPDLLQYMCSGPIIVLALRKENAVGDFRALMGTTDSTVARRTQPTSLRALYGLDKKYNAVHGSESREAAAREIALAFDTFSVGVQDTFCWVKPDAFDRADDIVHRLVDEGFTVVQVADRTLSPAQCRIFYEEHARAPFFPSLVQYMCSGKVRGMVLRKENAVRALRELCGPTSSIEAKASDPDSLRALYGTDALKNAVHSSKTADAAAREIHLMTQFFPGEQSTFAMLKPDLIAKQAEGTVLEMIKASGFEVLRKKAISFTKDQACQFYAEHEGKPFFDGLISFMTSGPCLAMELRAESGVAAWRGLLGPTNSATARETAPESIRALFGTDGRKNAAHGSDSVASAQRECKLVFETFASTLLTTSAS